MKKLMRIIGVLLVAAMLVPAQAWAAEEEAVMPCASTHISSTRNYIYGIDGSTFSVWYDILGTDTMDDIGASYIRIERSKTGTGSWSIMRMFNSSLYTDLLGHNTVRHNGSVTYTGTAGYYYRAYVMYYAGADGNSSYYGSYTSVVQLSA